MTDGWAGSEEDRRAGGRTGQRQVRRPRSSCFAYVSRGCVQKVKSENLITVIGASPRRRAEIKLNESPSAQLRERENAHLAPAAL